MDYPFKIHPLLLPIWKRFITLTNLIGLNWPKSRCLKTRKRCRNLKLQLANTTPMKKFKSLLLVLAVATTNLLLAQSSFSPQWIDLVGATQSNNILTKTSANGYTNVGG